MELRLHPPRPAEIVLGMEREWEGGASFVYSNLVQPRSGPFAGKLLLYYRGSPKVEKSDFDDGQVNCLAVSEDGVHFSRPSLGMIDYQGIRENNAVFSGNLAHNFSPFYDENPDCPPEERFKAVCGHYNTGLFLFVSADGIRWEKKQEAPIVTDGCFDSLNVLFYDTHSRCYRCYFRYFDNGESAPQNLFNGGVRAIASVSSPDLVHWSAPAKNRYRTDLPQEQFYTNATVPCPGAEQLLLAFPMRFLPERKKWPDYPEPGVSDSVLITSRDGIHWDRTFEEPWIAPSLDPKCWTQRNYVTARGIFATQTEMSFYVTEHYMWEDCHIRRYTLPRHRFASLHAGRRGGTALTTPFLLTGRGLSVNYATSAAGSLSLWIADREGNPISGYGPEDCGEIFGNQLELPLLWRGRDLSALAGQEIRLGINLTDADLYAFTLSD